MKIQISFAGNSDLKLIRKQLEKIVKYYSDATFYHCFLPRHVVEEKGFDTAIVNLLDEILGDKQVIQLKDCKSFNECMEKLYSKRMETSKLIDKMLVLGLTQEQIAKGIVEEIAMLTNDKCVFVID